LSVLLAASAIVLSGAGLVAALAPPSCGGALRVAMAAALGLGTWSATYAAALLLFGPQGLAAKDLLLAIAGAALLIASRRRDVGMPPEADAVPHWLWALLALSCAVATILFVEHTLRFPDGGWDAWMVWNLRARFLARAGAGFRAAFSPDLLYLAHQDYPFLLPGLVAQGFLLRGAEAAWIPVSLAWLYGALAVALLVSSLGWLRGGSWGVLGGLSLAAMPCFPTFASNQQSDVPLAVYLLISMALIAGPRSRPALLLAGFSAGLGMWTKNEGALFAACLAAALAWRDRDLRAVGWFALGALPLATLLVGFKLGVAPPTDLAALSTPQGVLAHALSLRRWAELLLLTLRRIVYFQDFGLWSMAEVLLLLFWVRKQPATVPGTALFLACLAFGPIYVLQPHRLDWIYRTSADRIFIQLWPSAVLATLLHLARATDRARTTART